MSSAIHSVHPHSMQSHRFHLLDGLRGLAAICVVLIHMPVSLRQHLPVANAWLAVDFFYCLSGFVIAFAYEGRFRAGLGMRDFLAARIIRLYPLYLLGTVLGVVSYLVVSGASGELSASILNLLSVIGPALLMLPNLPHHWPDATCFPLDGPAWSLASEFVANILFAVLLGRRFGSSVVIALLAGSSLLILATLPTFGEPSMNFGWSLPTFLPGLARVGYGFFTGVLLLRVWVALRSPLAARPRDWIAMVTALAAILAVLAAAHRFMPGVYFQVLLIALLFPAIVFFGARIDVPRWLVPACVFLGEISYPLYILHAPFVEPLSSGRFKHFSQSHAHLMWLTPIICIALIALSWVAGKFYDRIVRSKLTQRYNSFTLTEPLAAGAQRGFRPKDGRS